MSQAPDSLRFLTSHEWIDPKTGTVGISDHAQHELSDVVYVELPKVGAKVTAGAQVAVVESVKAASDIYAPASGEVIEVNTALNDDPSKVNSDPYGAGWIFKLKLTNSSEVDALLDGAGYAKHIGS